MQRTKLFTRIIVIVLLLLPLFVFMFNRAEANQNPLQAIRDNVAQFEGYRFTADVEQTLIPRSHPDNIGKGDERVDMRLDGEIASADSATLEIRFEGGGLSNDPIILKQEGENNYVLNGDEWVLVESPVSAVAPNGDFLVFWEAAQNVRPMENTADSAVPVGFTRYSFDIDGPTLAAHVVADAPSNPVTGVKPAPSPMIEKMSGYGELWIDDMGLPRRQIIDLHVPDASELHHLTTHMVMDFRFSDRATSASLPTALSSTATQLTTNKDSAALLAEPHEFIGGNFYTPLAQTTNLPPLPITEPNNALKVSVYFMMLAGGMLLTTILIARRRSSRLYAIVATTISLVMIFTPVLQPASFSYQTTHAAEAQSLTEALGMVESSSNKATNIQQTTTLTTDPIAQCGSGDPGVDTDGDTILDTIEHCLGTDPYAIDSDYDLVPDNGEIIPVYTDTHGTLFYSNPLAADSNMDGLHDFSEMALPYGIAPSWDGDGDDIPNHWDSDNDGDGVEDKIDLSPFSTTDYEDTHKLVFTQDEAPNDTIYIDIQLQPESPDHLRYTSSALDWPFDEAGQIRDLDETSQDLQLFPYLKITTDSIPSQELLDFYSVTSFTEDDQSILLTPLAPVSTGGYISAFNGKIAYGSNRDQDITWDDVGLVWLAFADVDTDYDTFVGTDPTSMAQYAASSKITGWSVTRTADPDYVLLGTPNSPDDDRELFQMLFGVSQAFLNSASVDTDELFTRFDGTNTDPVETWGVAAADVQAYRPPANSATHGDASAQHLATQVVTYLAENGYSTDGTMASLLVAIEESYGVANMDEGDVHITLSTSATPDGYSGGTTTINLSKIVVNRIRALKMGTYTYKEGSWATMALEEVIDEVVTSRTDLVAALSEAQVNYPDVTEQNLVQGLSTFYIQWTMGLSIIFETDGAELVTETISDFNVYNNVNLGTASLALYLLEVAGLIQEDAGIQVDTLEGIAAWSRDSDGTFLVPGYARWAYGYGNDLFEFERFTSGDWQSILVITQGFLATVMVASYIVYVYKSFTVIAKLNAANHFSNSVLAVQALRHTTFSSKTWMKAGLGVRAVVIQVIIYAAIFFMTTDFSDRRSVGNNLAYFVTAITFTLILAALSLIPFVGLVIGLILLIDTIVYFATGGEFSFMEFLIEEVAQDFFFEQGLTHLEDMRFGALKTSTNDVSNGLLDGLQIQFDSTLRGVLGKSSDDATDSDLRRGFVYGYVDASETVDATYSVDNEISSDTEAENDETYCTVADGEMTCRSDVSATFEFEAGINREAILAFNVGVRLQDEACGLFSEAGTTGCKNINVNRTYPEDLPNEDKWDSLEFTLDVLPNTVEGLWTWDALVNEDLDGDGLSGDEEDAVGTDSNDWDSDNDGLSDGFEFENADSLGTDPLDADSDDDGLSDGFEFRHISSIGNPDTDGDGLLDSEEIFHQDVLDFDDDGNTTEWWGGWAVNVPNSTQTYWMFSSPIDPDADLDNLNDASEKTFSTGSTAFNDAPALTLSYSPQATSPAGNTAAYLKPNDNLTVIMRLDNVGPTPITSTLSFCWPAALKNVSGGRLSGSVTPPKVRKGDCFNYDFSGDNALQVFDTISMTVSAKGNNTPISGTVTASFDYASINPEGTVQTSFNVVIDDDQPSLTIMAPVHNELIGHVSHYVFGGSSSDASSWVSVVQSPEEQTWLNAGGTSPWAISLPVFHGADQAYEFRAIDAVGNVIGRDGDTDSIFVYFTVDKIGPNNSFSLVDGEVISVTGDSNVSIDIPISGSSTDDIAGLTRIQISLDEKPWQTVWSQTGDWLTNGANPLAVNWSYDWQLVGGSSSQGHHSVRVRSYDLAGNESDIEEVNFIIDLLPPTDELTSRRYLNDPPHVQSGEALTLTGVTNDAGNLPHAPNPAELNGTLHSIDDATIWLQSHSIGDNDSGVNVTWIGDFNGDRMADLAVGLPAAEEEAGKITIQYGRAGDWPVPELVEVLGDSPTSFIGEQGSALGQYLAPAGDYDGDGLDDLLIGDPSNNRVFLVYGTVRTIGNDTPLEDSDGINWLEIGTSDPMTVGISMAGVGDVNDDGFDDLLIGATSAATGTVYLQLGKGGARVPFVDLGATAAAKITTSANGATVAGVGNVDDDFYQDFAVGAGNTVHLFYGSTGFARNRLRTMVLTEADHTFASSDALPAMVGLGDTDGDEVDDFIYANGNAPVVVFGDTLTTQNITGFAPAPNGFLAGVGDVDADAQNDVVIGNANGDAYLILGSDLSRVAATFTGVDSAASSQSATGADINSDGSSDILLVPSDSAGDDRGLDVTRTAVNQSQLPRAVTSHASTSTSASSGSRGLAQSRQVFVNSTYYVDDELDCEGQVPCYDNLQSAVDAAAAGDTIMVLPGIYTATAITTNDLTIQVTTLADATIIDGAGGNYGIKISNADGVSISDLTIRNVDYGVWLEDAGRSGWETPADQISLQGLLIYDFNTHAIYMNRISSVNVAQNTLAGSGEHIGLYGDIDPATIAQWSVVDTDSRYATELGGGMFQYENNLLFIHADGSTDGDVFNVNTSNWTDLLDAPMAVTERAASAVIDGEWWLLQSDPYRSRINGKVNDIEYVSDTEVYVAGNFTEVDGVTVDYVAMWDGTSWSAVGQGLSDAPNSVVNALAYDAANNYLYVGGRFGFRRYLGDSNSWENLGSITASGDCTQGVYALAIDNFDGGVYVGGCFSRFGVVGNGQLRNIARWNTNGTWKLLDQQSGQNCNAGTDDVVYALAVDEDNVYVGGEFDGTWGYNSPIGCNEVHVEVNNIVAYEKSSNDFFRLDISDVTDDSGISGLTGVGVYSLDLVGDLLVVGGDFHTFINFSGSNNYSRATNNLFIYDVSTASSTTEVSEHSRWDLNGPVHTVVADNANSQVYVAGEFNQGAVYGSSRLAANHIARIVPSSTSLSVVGEGVADLDVYALALTGSGNLYMGGPQDTTIDGTSRTLFSYWDGTEYAGQAYWLKLGGSGTWGNSWEMYAPPNQELFTEAMILNVDTPMVLRGGGTTDSYAYIINGNHWLTMTNPPTSPGDGAVMASAGLGRFYTLIADGVGTFCVSTFTSWDCTLASLPGGRTVDDGASLVWDGDDTIFATIGGNGTSFLSYSMADDVWIVLGDGSSATTDDFDLPDGASGGSNIVIYDNVLYYVAGNGTTTLYQYTPLSLPQTRLTITDTAFVVPEVTANVDWIEGDISSAFQISGTQNAFVGGGSTGWSPDITAVDGVTETVANAQFLDVDHGVYRLTAASTITAGYHRYRPDAYVGTSGEEFTAIQEAIYSGANQVLVRAGIYPGDIDVISGIELRGSGADRTVLEGDNAAMTQIIRAQGVANVGIAGFTLAGDGLVNGLLVEEDAQNIRFYRNIVRDTNNGILVVGEGVGVSGNELEAYNNTLVSNRIGMNLTECADMNVRNTIFAFNTELGLTYKTCAIIENHSYNNFWANKAHMFPFVPNGSEIFLDPLFVDLTTQTYETLSYSPVIDGGDPADSAPPGGGTITDIGYKEQNGMSFYVDHNYCETCDLDGLTWGIDAFDTIQDALDAAEAELKLLAQDDLRYIVGVAAGIYSETVSIPSYVQLTGESTPASAGLYPTNPSTALVTFDQAVAAGLSKMVLLNVSDETGVDIKGASNNIRVHNNLILSSGASGIVLSEQSTADIQFNTLSNATVSILASGAGSWATVENNLINNDDHDNDMAGLTTHDGGQLYSRYNLINTMNPYSGTVVAGVGDVVGVDPQLEGILDTGLQPTSPAIDAANPVVAVPAGGGDRADIGYRELLVAPISLFLGQLNESTGTAYSGVNDVEYGMVEVADASVSYTETIPALWSPISLDSPGVVLSYWEQAVAPTNEGLYRIYSRATDMVNNKESEVETWFAGEFYVDDTAPVVAWLSPTHNSTPVSPFVVRAEVADYVDGSFAVDSVYFTIDGGVVEATWAEEPWTDDGVSARVFQAFLDVSAGSHTLVAVAVDEAGNVASDMITVSASESGIVDTTPPTLNVISPVDGAAVTLAGSFVGTASDAESGVAAVEVSIDNGVSWTPAMVTGINWTLTLSMPTNSEFVSFPTVVRATDHAGNFTEVDLTLAADNLPPTGVTPVTFNYPEGYHFDIATTLVVTWQTPVDGSGVVSVSVEVDDKATGSPTTAVAGNSQSFTLGQDQIWYVHIAATDAAGNVALYDYGPWYVGSFADNTTPFVDRTQTILLDGSLDTDLDEWLTTEKIGDDERGLTAPAATTQDLYATWDGQYMYLGWEGASWDVDGDLWLYLYTAAGGTTTVMGYTQTLPFAANYAVSVHTSTEGYFWTYDGSSWSSAPLDFVQGDNEQLEIRFPLALDGVPLLRLFGFGVDDLATIPWTVMPTTNPLNGAWFDYYEWGNPSAVTVINDGQPDQPSVFLTVNSDHSMFATAGANDTISLDMTITNWEEEAVSGLEATFVASTDWHITSVVNGNCVANCSDSQRRDFEEMVDGNSNTIPITITGDFSNNLIDLAGVPITVTLSQDGALLDIERLTFAVDSTPPTVTVDFPLVDLLAIGENKLTGYASDFTGGGVALVEVRANGGAWQPAMGTNVWSTDVVVPLATTNYPVEVRATDIHGLVSDIVAINYIIDTVPPTATLSSSTVVSGAFTTLTGVAVDPFPEAGYVAELAIQLDDSASVWQEGVVFGEDADGEQNWAVSWNLPTEDGVTHTLRISATDAVGNVGTSDWFMVTVDNVPPVLAISTTLTTIGLNDASHVLAGTVTDGLGVARVLIYAYALDGTVAVESANLIDDHWYFAPAYSAANVYRYYVVAVDVAGNRSQLGSYELTVAEGVPVAVPQVELTLDTIHPLTDTVVSWDYYPGNTGGNILYWSTDVYFDPGDAGVISVTIPITQNVYNHIGVAGENYYYLMQGVKLPDEQSALSPRQGKFSFCLTPGTAAGVNYQVKDSTDFCGPVLDFEDISGSGAALTLGDNEAVATAIGFDYEFYDVLYDMVYVGSNGILSFDEVGADSATPANLPDGVVPNNLIAGWWADLDPSIGGTVHVETLGSAPYRRFIVQYTDVPHKGGGNLVTFQFVLSETDGSVVMQYLDAPSDGTLHVIGIEDVSGTAGTTYYADSLGLPMRWAVNFVDKGSG